MGIPYFRYLFGGLLGANAIYRHISQPEVKKLVDSDDQCYKNIENHDLLFLSYYSYIIKPGIRHPQETWYNYQFGIDNLKLNIEHTNLDGLTTTY